MIVQTRNGQNLTLGEEINRGGEARIWTVQREPQQLAKLYFTPTAQHEAKLRAMLANPPRQPRDHTAIAWPTDLLYQNGSFLGFLMPRVYDCHSIFRIYNPMLRSKLQEPFSWNAFLHRTARNLAAALELVHARGHVVGDLNESNILVTRDARVTLVDADSFQVRSEQGQLYHCPVAKAEFLPPELNGTDLRSVSRTAEQDHFGLAVLIWYLLMEGYHPFQGVLQRGPSVERVHLYSMERGFFPYHNFRVVPPPNALALTQLHPQLADAFLRAFVNGFRNPAARPGAKEWQQLLIHAEEALVACAENNRHYYHGQLRRCPVCHPIRRRLTLSQRAYGTLVKMEQLARPLPELSPIQHTKLLADKARSVRQSGVERMVSASTFTGRAATAWQQLQPPLAFGARWTALNVAGAAAGFLAILVLRLLLTNWLGLLMVGENALIVDGALFGLVLGDAQWRAFAPQAPKRALRRAGWVLSMGMAALVAAAGGESVTQILPQFVEDGLGNVRPLITGLLLGGLMGSAQWLLLSYHMQRKVWLRGWLMSCLSGWAVAGLGWLVGGAIDLSWRVPFYTQEHLWGNLFGGLIGVFLYGVLTSGWLYGSLRQGGRKQSGWGKKQWRFGSGIWLKRRSLSLPKIQKEAKQWAWSVLLLIVVLSILQGLLAHYTHAPH